MRLFWVAFGAVFFVKTAFANSYVEMITTPPPEAELSQPVSVEVPVQPFAWYDSRIKTSAPVVTSPYPKYTAWARSMENENFIDNTRDELQHLVYMVEGGLLGLGLYEIYFRR
ncbi:MAG: hypothetical protein J6A09_03325 [Alphaproteobacteria bacterium]|nr:hypothetical protein [Alphaproteobacteria bacterium]